MVKPTFEDNVLALHEKAGRKVRAQRRAIPRKPILSGEQFDKLGVWIVGAFFLLAMWWHSHDLPESHDALPAAAWAFGQPGE